MWYFLYPTYLNVKMLTQAIILSLNFKMYVIFKKGPFRSYMNLYLFASNVLVCIFKKIRTLCYLVMVQLPS